MKEKKESGLPWWIVFSIISSIIITLAITTIWKRNAEIKDLERQLGKTRSDLEEVRGDLSDMKGTPLAYLMLYRRATLARFERIEPRWDEIMETSWRMSIKHGIPADVVIGQMETESGFDPAAIGPKGEIGLLQVYPPAWPQFDIAKGFDIDYNIDFALGVLAACLKQTAGDIREALRFYNGQGKLPEGMKPYADRVLSGRSMRIK